MGDVHVSKSSARDLWFRELPARRAPHTGTTTPWTHRCEAAMKSQVQILTGRGKFLEQAREGPSPGDPLAQPTATVLACPLARLKPLGDASPSGVCEGPGCPGQGAQPLGHIGAHLLAAWLGDGGFSWLDCKANSDFTSYIFNACQTLGE